MTSAARARAFEVKRARALLVAAEEAHSRSNDKNGALPAPRSPTSGTPIVVPHPASLALIPYLVFSPSPCLRATPPIVAEALFYPPPARDALMTSCHHLFLFAPAYDHQPRTGGSDLGSQTLVYHRCTDGVLFRCGYTGPTPPACDFSGAREREASSYG